MLIENLMRLVAWLAEGRQLEIVVFPGIFPFLVLQMMDIQGVITRLAGHAFPPVPLEYLQPLFCQRGSFNFWLYSKADSCLGNRFAITVFLRTHTSVCP
jgi:hypothetical protein